MSLNFKTRDAIVLAVALLGGGQARAQEMPADVPVPEKTAADASDRAASIAGARKDFEAVKSLRDFGGEAKSESPRLAIPRMQSETEPAPLALKPKTLETDKKSSTWLIDAMEKGTPARGARGTEARFPETSAVDQRAGRDGRPPVNVETVAREREGPANPFARYLGEWISPHDYTLLKPALDPLVSKEVIRAKTPGAQTPLAVFSPQPASGVRPPEFVAPAARLGPPDAGRENPYLEIVKSSGPPPLAELAAAKPYASVAKPAPTVGITKLPEAPPAVPQSRIPDFVRPNPDDKYFKQLKRF